MEKVEKEVIALYHKGDSLKNIARTAKISEWKARKILANAGLSTGKTGIAVADLHRQGKDVDEIAARLGISRNAVISYLPYSKGMQHAENPSKNALAIRACRARKSK